MTRLILTEMRIMMKKKGFQFTLILITLLAFSTSIYLAYLQRGQDETSLYHPAILSLIDSDFDYSWFLFRLYPFIIILPAGFSIMNDRAIKISSIIAAKKGMKQYYTSKIIAGFLVTFLAITIPLFLEMCLNIIIFPHAATKSMRNWPTYGNIYMLYASRYLFGNTFLISPYLNFAISVFFLGMYSGSAAVFVLGISTFRIKYKILLFLPFYFAYMYVGDIAKIIIKNNQTYIDLYLSAFDPIKGKSIIYYLTMMFILLIIGIMCVLVNIKKAEVN